MQLALVTSCHPRRGLPPGPGMLQGRRPQAHPHAGPRQHPAEGSPPTANSPGLDFLQLPASSAPISPSLHPTQGLMPPHPLPGLTRGAPPESCLLKRAQAFFGPQHTTGHLQNGGELGGQTQAEGHTPAQHRKSKLKVSMQRNIHSMKHKLGQSTLGDCSRPAAELGAEVSTMHTPTIAGCPTAAPGPLQMRHHPPFSLFLLVCTVFPSPPCCLLLSRFWLPLPTAGRAT